MRASRCTLGAAPPGLEENFKKRFADYGAKNKDRKTIQRHLSFLNQRRAPAVNG